MRIVIALSLWLTLIGLAARWPDMSRRSIQAMTLLGAGVILAGSGFWQGVVYAAWTGDSVPLLGPSAAFASVWILVLLPLWRQRLDAGVVASSLLAGLLAMAALGTALDLSHLTFSRLPFSAGVWSAALMITMIAALFLTGFALERWATGRCFPWEYIAWCAGLLIMAQPAHPVLVQINPGADHGLWTLAILLAVSGSLERSQRSHRPFIWIGIALWIPIGVSLAVAGCAMR